MGKLWLYFLFQWLWRWLGTNGITRNLWQWLDTNSKQIEIIAVIVGVVVIVIQIKQSSRAIARTEDTSKKAFMLNTINYLDELVPQLIEGTKWANRDELLKTKEFSELSEANWIKLVDKTRKHLAPIVTLYYGIEQGALDKDIIKKAVYPQIKGLHDHTEDWVGYIRKEYNKNGYIELEKLYILLTAWN